MFDAYESDLPWVKSGDKIDFTIQSIPGKNYSAKVSYIDPFINGRTRVAQLRVEIKNNDMQIKPEMFTRGILQSNIADMEFLQGIYPMFTPPGDVAKAIAFLANDDTGYITGQVLCVDGGMAM